MLSFDGQAEDYYERQQHSTYIARYGVDVGVFCRSLLAFPLWCSGYPDRALQKGHEALTLAQEFGHPFSVAVALARMVQVHQFRREVSAAYAWAELHRLQGEILLQQSGANAAQAETCFQRVLAIARRQQAKSLELRAAMSLSRLWQQHGKQAEAWQLLSDVYGWFTEGFETADLQEARSLLDRGKDSG
jgi:hypothetical protein